MLYTLTGFGYWALCFHTQQPVADNLFCSVLVLVWGGGRLKSSRPSCILLGAIHGVAGRSQPRPAACGVECSVRPCVERNVIAFPVVVVVVVDHFPTISNHAAQVSLPKPNTWTASFSARLETEPDGASGFDPLAAAPGGLGGGSGRRDDAAAAAAGGGCSNPTTDGVYVYVWDAASKRVHKASVKKGGDGVRRGEGFYGDLWYIFASCVLVVLRL